MTNNAVFEKTVENVKKHKDIKLVTTEKKKYLVSDPNYPTTKFYTENLLAIEMKKKRDNFEQTCPLRTFNIRIK